MRCGAGEPGLRAFNLAAQQLIDHFRIRLPATLLHDLADEEAECLLLAGSDLGDRIRMGAHHRVHRVEEGLLVGVLREPLCRDPSF